ncbi:MAG TPA: transporter substrate-binding domain-containing protein [Methylococcaceae bacterium]|nr:transporter substrate-binding domain-containing protein [Methylococcaceae bacterium]
MNCGKAMLKRRVFLLVAGLLVLTVASQAAAGGLEDARRRGKLLAGVKTDFPPFGFVDRAGAIQGFDIDIARYLAKALFGEEGRLELVPVTSGSRIPYLYSEWIDIIIATMTMTGERRQVLEFSEPYFISGSLLMALKDSGIRGIEDLAGKTVAVIEGAVQEKELQQLAPAAKQIKFDKIPEALGALKEKRVDAFCQDDVVILDLARENPELRAVGKPFIPRPYAMAVRKGDREFVGWVNKQLDKMKQDGSYEKIWGKYLGEFGANLIKP